MRRIGQYRPAIGQELGGTEQLKLEGELAEIASCAAAQLTAGEGEMVESFLHFGSDQAGEPAVSEERPSLLRRIGRQRAEVKIQDYCAELGVDRRLLRALNWGAEEVVQINSGTHGDLGDFEAGYCVVRVVKSGEGTSFRVERGEESNLGEANLPVWELAGDDSVEVWAGYGRDVGEGMTLTCVPPGLSQEEYLDLMRRNWQENRE